MILNGAHILPPSTEVRCRLEPEDCMHQMKFAPRVLLALLLAVMSAQRAGAQAGVTVFHGARVIVGDGRAIENAAFIVEGGRFAWVGVLGDAKIPPTATSVDLK